MSTRGAKGAKAVHAVGGTDGGDFSHRQVLAPRYEAMATYRSGLRNLFVVVPLVYAISALLTVIHFTAPGLVAMSKQFLLPFPVQLCLLLLCGALSVWSIRLQSSPLFLVLSAASTLFLIYLSIIYTMQALGGQARKGEAAGYTWYLLGAAVNAIAILLQTLANYYGYMILQLQGSGAGKKAY